MRPVEPGVPLVGVLALPGLVLDVVRDRARRVTAAWPPWSPGRRAALLVGVVVVGGLGLLGAGLLVALLLVALLLVALLLVALLAVALLLVALLLVALLV